MLKKLFNVGFDDIAVVERRAVSLQELSRYPLFAPEFIAFLREVVPAHRHDALVHAVEVTARKPVVSRPPNQCPTCRHDNAIGARFCNQCGARLADPAASGPAAAGEAQYDVHALLDAGSGGCEEGALLKLRDLMTGLDAGQVLEVRSTDPGVREDLPAWCRLTGHEFLGAKGSRYFLRKS
ncbi:MAG: sulfurtransferase TusA family protein [Candidatus Rokuibacteriota bacterium]